MNMKAHLLAGIATAVLTLPAMAADMPLKAPPLPPAPVFSWTGFYLGGNAGYGLGRDPVTMGTVSGAGFPTLAPGTALYGAPRQFTLAPHGWAAGVQAGYNLQIAPAWVIGLEADIQGTGMKDGENCVLACNARIATVPGLSLFPVVFSDVSAAHKLDWFGTVRGRIGATAGPALFYVTGGGAYGEVERKGRAAGSTVGAISGATINTFAGAFDNKSTKTGWTVGGGVEGMLGAGWSAKAEYLYVDLGTVSDSFNTVFLTGGGGAVAGTVAANRVDRSSIHDHIFRIGLNYHLGGGNPAYAMAAATPARSARAQYPMAPVDNWAGFYLGPNFGYGVGKDSTTMTTVSGAGFTALTPGTALYGAPRQFALVPHGFVGGGGAGYNWQATPTWLFGVEADLQGTDMKDRANCLLSCNARISTVPTLSLFPVVFSDVSAAHKLNWLATVRGRVGATVGPALFYVTGGAAFAEVERSGRAAGSTVGAISGTTINTFAGSFNAKSTKDGWTLGGGVEGMVMSGWSAKAEYLYVDLGRTSDSFNTIFLTGGGVGNVAATRTDQSNIRDHIFRVGLNYHITP